jgi:hypothetical protein
VIVFELDLDSAECPNSALIRDSRTIAAVSAANSKAARPKEDNLYGSAVGFGLQAGAIRNKVGKLRISDSHFA